MKVHIDHSQMERKTIFGRSKGMGYGAIVRVELSDEEKAAVEKAALGKTTFISLPLNLDEQDRDRLIDFEVQDLFKDGISVRGFTKAELDEQIEDVKKRLNGLKAEIEAVMDGGGKEETFEL